MTTERYRLRYQPGVVTTSATYGSGNYGTQTYGQLASDPLSTLRYRLVPWPKGFLSDPAWQYRHADTEPPFQVQVVSNEAPLNLTPMATVELVLTPYDEPDVSYRFDLTADAPLSSGRLSRVWQPGDLTIEAGDYRASIQFTFLSGRQLTLPTDDRHRFSIYERPGQP